MARPKSDRCRKDLHDMVPENLYISKSGRYCLACRRVTLRRDDERRQAQLREATRLKRGARG